MNDREQAGRADSSASDVERARAWLREHYHDVRMGAATSSLATEFAAIRREAIENWIADSVVPSPAAHFGEILAQAGLRAVHADNDDDRITDRNWNAYRGALAAAAHNLIAAAVKVGREQGARALAGDAPAERV